MIGHIVLTDVSPLLVAFLAGGSLGWLLRARGHVRKEAIEKGGNMPASRNIALLAALSLVLLGCGGGEAEHEHGEHGGGAEESVRVGPTYAEAIGQCESRSTRIDRMIVDGHLGDVHAAAASIQKIAEKLPELARKDLPAELLREINIASKKLAGLFGEIDEAADAGRKEDTIQVHDRMKALIADLKKHADKVIEKTHDEHEEEGHDEH